MHRTVLMVIALAAHHLIATSSKPKIDSEKLAAAMAQISVDLYKPSGGTFDY